MRLDTCFTQGDPEIVNQVFLRDFRVHFVRLQALGGNETFVVGIRWRFLIRITGHGRIWFFPPILGSLSGGAIQWIDFLLR